MRRLAPLALLLPCLAAAQSDLVGKDRFPEFRTFSALPGCTFGIDESGRITHLGAMGISTPVAHSLGRDQWAFGVGNTSLRGSLRFFKDRNGLADGTGWGMTGFTTPYGNFTVGGMILSTKRDSVLNLQFTPKTEWDNVEVAVGVQDAFSTGGSSGEAIDLPNGGGNSRSLYAAATVKLWEGAYGTLGAGTRRFEGVFGNLSFNVHPRVKLVVENDTFNWNYGASLRLGEAKVAGRTVTGNLFLGQIRGKYWTWAVNLGF